MKQIKVTLPIRRVSNGTVTVEIPDAVTP